MKQTRIALSVLVTTLTLLSAFGLAQQANKVDQPTVKQMTLEPVTLSYLEQGQGETVVFVHGAFADHRTWEEQREAVAKDYRYVALDQRYYGNSPWTDDGSNHTLATHVSDLAAFIRRLDAGPAHIVGWSYGSNVALDFAVQHPELVRSLFLYEPAYDSIVSDPADVKTLGEEWASNGAFPASQAGNQAEAVRLFTDWISVKPGSFDELEPSVRKVLLENSRTLPLLFAAPPNPPLTCAQLGRIEAPVTVAKGQQTRPAFEIYSNSTHECIPGSQLVSIPDATHVAPLENPSGFNEALLSHLKGSGTKQ
jgi:pimeloyl-ACP methyl ester carboxylesterase